MRELRWGLAAAMLGWIVASCSTPNPSTCSQACLTGQVCVAGVCREKDCATAICAPAEVCLFGACRPAACTVARCLEGELCTADAGCQPTGCGGRDCADGEVCVGNACVDSRCAGVVCPFGEICANGYCVPGSCASRACVPGSVCFDGGCTDSPCVGVVCPAGRQCSQGACVDGVPPGDACQRYSECDSLICADGVCCQRECLPYRCTAGGGTCEQSCNSQAQCQTGFACAPPNCVDAGTSGAGGGSATGGGAGGSGGGTAGGGAAGGSAGGSGGGTAGGTAGGSAGGSGGGTAGGSGGGTITGWDQSYDAGQCSSLAAVTSVLAMSDDFGDATIDAVKWEAGNMLSESGGTAFTTVPSGGAAEVVAHEFITVGEFDLRSKDTWVRLVEAPTDPNIEVYFEIRNGGTQWLRASARAGSEWTCSGHFTLSNPTPCGPLGKPAVSAGNWVFMTVSGGYLRVDVALGPGPRDGLYTLWNVQSALDNSDLNIVFGAQRMGSATGAGVRWDDFNRCGP